MDQRSQSGMDMISSLPAEILKYHILNLLTVNEQARTSVLSKQWRSIWLSLIIPSPTFALQVSTMNPIIQSSIDNIIARLASRSVEELTLEAEDYNVSTGLFALVELAKLVLTGCCLVHAPPPSFQGFANLTSVGLSNVLLEVDLSDLVSTWCPVLTTLEVHRCDCVDALVVDSRRLEILDITSDFRSICFRNAPVLKWLRVETESESRLPSGHMKGSMRFLRFRETFGNVLPTLEEVLMGSAEEAFYFHKTQTPRSLTIINLYFSATDEEDETEERYINWEDIFYP